MQEVRITRHRGVMHTYPANEACNLDQVTKQASADSPAEGRHHHFYRRDCKRCFDAEQE